MMKKKRKRRREYYEGGVEPATTPSTPPPASRSPTCARSTSSRAVRALEYDADTDHSAAATEFAITRGGVTFLTDFGVETPVAAGPADRPQARDHTRHRNRRSIQKLRETPRTARVTRYNRNSRLLEAHRLPPNHRILSTQRPPSLLVSWWPAKSIRRERPQREGRAVDRDAGSRTGGRAEWRELRQWSAWIKRASGSTTRSSGIRSGRRHARSAQATRCV